MNPEWYTITISQAGDMTVLIDADADVDVDFVLWGPFDSTTNA